MSWFLSVLVRFGSYSAGIKCENEKQRSSPVRPWKKVQAFDVRYSSNKYSVVIDTFRFVFFHFHFSLLEKSTRAHRKSALFWLQRKEKHSLSLSPIDFDAKESLENFLRFHFHCADSLKRGERKPTVTSFDVCTKNCLLVARPMRERHCYASFSMKNDPSASGFSWVRLHLLGEDVFSSVNRKIYSRFWFITVLWKFSYTATPFDLNAALSKQSDLEDVVWHRQLNDDTVVILQSNRCSILLLKLKGFAMKNCTWFAQFFTQSSQRPT